MPYLVAMNKGNPPRRVVVDVYDPAAEQKLREEISSVYKECGLEVSLVHLRPEDTDRSGHQT